MVEMPSLDDVLATLSAHPDRAAVIACGYAYAAMLHGDPVTCDSILYRAVSIYPTVRALILDALSDGQVHDPGRARQMQWVVHRLGQLEHQQS